MRTHTRHPALTAGIAYEDQHFALRGRCSDVADDMSVTLVFMEMDTTSMEAEESEWLARIRVSGTIQQRGYPVAVRIELQDRQADLQVALEAQCLVANTGAAHEAVSAVDEVLVSLDQLVTSILWANRVTPIEVTATEVVPLDLPF